MFPGCTCIYQLSDLAEGVLALLWFLIPFGIWLLLWKTSKKQRSSHSTSVLGLNGDLEILESSPRYLCLLGVVTSAFTFIIGVLSFHAFMFLQDIARSFFA
jgi:hypothetical protein